jgi:hypothetical protein
VPIPEPLPDLHTFPHQPCDTGHSSLDCDLQSDRLPKTSGRPSRSEAMRIKKAPEAPGLRCLTCRPTLARCKRQPWLFRSDLRKLQHFCYNLTNVISARKPLPAAQFLPLLVTGYQEPALGQQEPSLPFRLIMSGFRSLNIVRSAGDVLTSRLGRIRRLDLPDSDVGHNFIRHKLGSSLAGERAASRSSSGGRPQP